MLAARFLRVPPSWSDGKAFILDPAGRRACLSHIRLQDTLGRTIDDYTDSGGDHVRITAQPELTISITRVAPSQLTLFDRAHDVVMWRDHEPCKRFENKS